MDIVIGSGPSGIACAHALLEKKRKVLLLDFGTELEKKLQVIVNKLVRTPYNHWEASDIAHIKKDYVNSSSDELKNKLIYGSDYPYLGMEKYYELNQNNVEVTSSLASGGFSNVWGGAVFPVCEDDIINWPISVNELENHYRKVLSFMSVSAISDALMEKFPTYKNNNDCLSSSRQAERLLNKLSQNYDKLKGAGYTFGKSRLAVNTNKNKFGFDCCYCGMCMYGCPYQLIFSSKYLLQDMKAKFENFVYKPNVFVDKIEEKKGLVNIRFYDRNTNELKKITGDRVFLGGGALSTTAILLKSYGEYNQSIVMKDSQYFLFPFITFSSIKNVSEEKLHTLAQLFIEVFDSEISKNNIHLQVYSYNDFFYNKLKNMSKIFFPLIKDLVLGRLFLVQGYLNSDYSHEISVKLERNKNTNMDILSLKKIVNPVTSQTIREILKKINRDKFLLGGFPIKFMLDIAKPGRSFHVGATFPMTISPGKFESDLLGRPYGFEKVFIVDSSNFPSIPSSTITLTAMANAHRIGYLST